MHEKTNQNLYKHYLCNLYAHHQLGGRAQRHMTPTLVPSHFRGATIWSDTCSEAKNASPEFSAHHFAFLLYPGGAQ